MKNIHVLPTDKPSYLYQIGNDLTLSVVNSTHQNNIGRHIYITSDEEPEDQEIHLCASYNQLHSHKHRNNIDSCKTIILTTDQNLIDNGVQAIDDEFLEWFVKNPSCEEVEVEESTLLNTSRTYLGVDKYKIIIPKEEPKQETLEEAALIYASKPRKFGTRMTFIDGDKWQQEQDKKMYSEEEVENILIEYVKTNPTKPYRVISWFREFKNK